MLKLDQFSESILFECDRCLLAGELISQIVEEEGEYFCWNCLKEINLQAKERIIPKMEEFVSPKGEFDRKGFFECVRCRIQGERKSFALEENGGSFCISCWLEKENKRWSRPAVSAGV